MQPKIELLTPDLIHQVLDEAFQLLMRPGVKVQSATARRLLAEAGAQVDEAAEVVKIPPALVNLALQTAAREFYLFDRFGNPTIHYGGDAVHFDPGSSGVHILDPDTLEHRPARTPDLIRLIKVAEMLPQYEAQSTAVVCHDVPEEISDLYRLYLVLRFSSKPIVTGAFRVHTLQHMIAMLAIFAGGHRSLAEKPQAIFDVCPSPPLIWSQFGAENLIELARAGVPAQIVSMPLAGVAAPVTLFGAVVQHAAETLSGIVIHQLARPGAPVVWGGAAAILDMRKGTTPMGAIESAMINIACAQVGKALGLPTHTYLGASDAKVLDAQAGLESGMTALLGGLAGINMISGGGMLDFLACQSAEKLVVDAEVIAMVKRLLAGMKVHTPTLALELFEGIHFRGDFLKQPQTRQLFPREQYLPTQVIDRETLHGWLQGGRSDTFIRARERVQALLQEYRSPPLIEEQVRELQSMVEGLAIQAGLQYLPPLG